MSARDEILGRIRAALGPAAPPSPDSSAKFSVDDGPPDQPGALVARFVERVEDYRATVTRADTEDLREVVAAICGRHGVATLAVPDGLPEAWVPAGVAALPADATAIRALANVDGVLTTCLLGVAETGTIALDGGPGQGPRVATLLPDLHICVVEATRIVPGVAELTEAMATAVREHGRPLTLVSGPSATSDIELDRVEGVHGPRRLEVVVLG